MKRLLLIGCMVLGMATAAMSQARKVQRLPYVDQRQWHYGFFLGLHTQDLKLWNSGLANSGEEWYVDTPDYSPGFTVGVLGELYLTRHFALRIQPSIAFGDKKVVFKEQQQGETYSQDVKSVYALLPVDLKFSAERFNNHRPYIVVGVMPAYDFVKTKSKPVKLNAPDCYLEVGLGCDFYLKNFKLIPELKFSFGLTDVLTRNRPDLAEPEMKKYAQTMTKARSRMISLLFYFE